MTFLITLIFSTACNFEILLEINDVSLSYRRYGRGDTKPESGELTPSVLEISMISFCFFFFDRIIDIIRAYNRSKILSNYNLFNFTLI
jgi:hypothetical protein